jgi:pimeloyl-ACP methyl ester carboxylesterase
MRNAVIHGLLSAILSVQFASGADAADSPGAVIKPVLFPCNLPDLPRPARCGVFDVPENRDAPNGRRLSISVAVVSATDGRALPDPIVVLMGGPGEDALSAAGIFAKQFAPLLKDRDLVLIDQRGTGKLGALRCQLYSANDPETSLRDFFPPAAVDACARQLRRRADLTQYTYKHVAHDVEHIRRSLGYGPLNVSAGSYGTRAAQVFIRTYPQSVRTAYLGSVVPIDVPTPTTFAKTADDLFERTFGACAADPACHKAFPNLREEFRQILTRLETGNVRVSVPGHASTVQMHRGRVAEWLRALLYRPSSAAALPWTIHRAYEGDWQPIAKGILSGARERDSAISFGFFFSITCNEDVPFLREEDILRLTQGTVLGDYRPRQQIAACRNWPKVTLPNDYRSPVHTSVPTMFVSGDTDGGSPLWFTEHVAPGFSNRVEIVMVNRGHTEWNDCIGRLYERFVRVGAVTGIDPASCKPELRPPFKTS